MDKAVKEILSIVGLGKKASKELELPFGEDNDKKLSETVIQHATAGTAISLVPVPVLDLAALVGNIWVMYARLNEAVHISFSENFLKSIASAVITNVLSVLPTLGIAAGAGSILKAFPGIGTTSGIMIGFIANVCIMYVAGMIYVKSLTTLANSGKALTEENIKQATRQVSKDKKFIRSRYEKGKLLAKKANKKTNKKTK